MNKQIEKSKKYFDLIANHYDTATSISGAWNPPELIYKNISKYISEKTTILDIGIGTGQSIDQIYKNGKYNQIYGVDVSNNILEICKSKYPNLILKQINEINDLHSVSNNKFDLIICSGTLEFIDDIEGFFLIIKNILNTNGIICFTYEPVILFHQIQNQKVSLTVSSQSSSLYIDGFNTYRYAPFEIFNILKKNNMSVIEDIEFISYKKADENIIYHLVISENL